ncbi:MAG: pectate lyase [Lewinellaceae bacterium]|nr:pectate lyase [Lewinellaceae bacterium]
MHWVKFIPLLGFLVTTRVSAQTAEQGTPTNYLEMNWKEVATQMPDQWYGSTEAKAVAENVLMAQKEIGGWAKNKPYHHQLSDTEKAQFLEEKDKVGATFDNGATITELTFLAKVYSNAPDDRYRQAFMLGVDYILMAQYENGGWPQFFPVRTGQSVAYSAHITYNDNAMVNIMAFLEDLYTGDKTFAALQIDSTTLARAKKAFEQGVQCILKTQIIVDGHPTVWCAQHDAVTLAPAKARKYELESFSGSESVNIVLLLMKIKNPSPAIIASVTGAVQWFDSHKLEGIKLVRKVGADGKKDLVVVADPNAPPLWARFYDLATEKPFFCDRDGIKKDSVAEIGYERRNGYGWYTDTPAKLFSKYPDWLNKLK